MSPREKSLLVFSEIDLIALIKKFLYFSFLGVIVLHWDQPNLAECKIRIQWLEKYKLFNFSGG
jgi:hypothetical protein